MVSTFDPAGRSPESATHVHRAMRDGNVCLATFGFDGKQGSHHIRYTTWRVNAQRAARAVVVIAQQQPVL